MARLYIFDADGTLRTTTVAGQPCPHAAHEQRLLPDVRASLACLPRGTLFGVASNQDQVGYGLVGEATARALLRTMLEGATGRAIADGAIRLCPHRLEVACRCRKPRPGMLLDLLRFFGVSAREAVFIGDAECDRAAAQAAGVRFRWAHELFRRRR